MKKKNIIDNISTKFLRYLDSFWNMLNQIPPVNFRKNTKKYPVTRSKNYWTKKKKPSIKNLAKDKIHNEWPLGSERTETKIFNKLRR